MSGNMTAAFRLDFTVGSLEQVQGAKGVLSELVQSLKELAQGINPFAQMMEPVAAAKAVTRELNETLNATGAAAAGVETATAAVTGLDEALRVTGGAAAEVGNGLHRLDGISGIFEQGAWAVNDLNVGLRGLVQAETAAGTGMRAIGADAEAAASQSVSAMERIRAAMSGIGSGGMGYARNVGGAVRGFGGAIEEGVGRAFGAAATGFGLVMPVKAAAEYDNTATHIGITLGKNGADNEAFASPFKRDIDRMARQTGQRSNDLMEAASFFSMEGYSLDRIKSFLPSVAHISTAYNAHPDAVARTAFQLQENMGIGEKEMPQALAELARVGKEAALPLEQLAPLFPQVAAQAGRLGVHGISGVADLAGFMAVIRKSAGSEGQALADFRAFMQTMTTQHGRKRYEKEFGVDPLRLMQTARHQGKDPLLAVLGNITGIKDQDKRERVVADLFANEMDQGFVGAVTGHYQQFTEIRDRVGKTSPTMIDADFKTGLQSTQTVLNSFEDALAQLERRVGDGFVPILKVATSGLHGLTGMFDWLDDHVPGAATSIVGAAGGMLALATAMGAIGAVAGPLKAGFTLLRLAVPLRAGFMLLRAALAPISALLGGVSLATMGIVAAVAALVAGVVVAALYVSRNMVRLGHAFDAGGKGITGALKGTWNVAKMVFNDFTHWLDSWGGGLGTKLHSIVAGLGKILGAPLAAMFHGAMDEFRALDNAFASSWVGRHLGMSGMGGAQPAPAVSGANSASSLHLHVSSDDGLKVRPKPGTRPPGNVTLHQNNGRMIAQP
jgi:TP901 family phage tail tape measure protein